MLSSVQCGRHRLTNTLHIGLLIAQLLLGQSVLAQSLPPDTHDFAERVAIINQLDVNEFKQVIECESGFHSDAIGDHGTSIGVAQIHLVSHPKITKQMALDPYFSISWMGQQWAEGNATMWTCYRLIHFRTV